MPAKSKSLGLPKYVQYDKNGKIIYRRRGCPTRYLKSSPGDPGWDRELDAIAAENERRFRRRDYWHVRHEPITDGFLAPDGNCMFRGMEKSAKARAKKYHLQYDLPSGWCKNRFREIDGICEVSGIQFRKDRLVRSPFMPSLDRVDPQLGYTPDNCRLVAYIVNCAMSHHDFADFYEMCVAVHRRHRGKVKKRAKSVRKPT